jgi:cation transport ATPase
VKKTVEFQIKQEEDQHIAEALYMMRQAQIKAEQLEQELARERAQINAERQNIVLQQKSIREQAKLRYETLRKRLQARWTIGLTMMTTLLLLLLPLFQFACLSLLKVPFTASLLFSLLAPIIICVGLASYFAHLRSISHTHQLQMARIKKATGDTSEKKTS